MWRKGGFLALLVRMLIGAATMKKSMESQKLLYSQRVLPLSIYLKKTKILIQKDVYMHSYVHCIFIYNSQDMETVYAFIHG